MEDQRNHLNRREFVAKGMAAGFALAAGPVSAWAITTNSSHLTAGVISIPTGDKPIPGYRAMPDGKGPFPTVLICHEIFGVHEFIRDVCRRFAKLGYLAVAPDLYARQGDVTQIKEIDTLIGKVVSKVPEAQVLSDLDATWTWAEKSGKADLARAAVTGFCWGGRATWLYAAHNPRLKAGAAWYGPLVGTTPPLQPTAPLDIAGDLKVPVLGLYGGKDGHILPEHVKKMEEALKKGKSGSKIVVFPEAPHGFLADYRDSYRKDAAESAWKQLQEWFREHGAA